MKTKLLVLLSFVVVMGLASSSAWGAATQRYDALMGSKDPYIGQNNEKATLAWGASYHLLSYVVMFEKTRQEKYLDRAVRLIDSILKQRDDSRKVKDYRGASGACWRNLLKFTIFASAERCTHTVSRVREIGYLPL